MAADLRREPADVQARLRLVTGPGEAAPDLVPRPFDLVLCHGVLMYLDGEAAMLAALTGVAAPEAGLSLLVRNGLAMAMRHGLHGDYPAPLAAFDTPGAPRASRPVPRPGLDRPGVRPR